MKTVFITGASSGFGLETARLFHERGWNVVATMRTPRGDLLLTSDRLRILPLDVTDEGSISRAVAEAGPIDALVNNAGAGLLGALEGVTMDATRALFAVNTFGPMAVTQAVLPGMRERGDGMIINVSSAVTLEPLPLLSAYTASKAALEAFSETLALELEPFGIRVRLVILGRSPETAFGAAARTRSNDTIPAAYAVWAREVLSANTTSAPTLTAALDVAEAVWRAVTSPDTVRRIPAGADAVALAARLAGPGAR